MAQMELHVVIQKEILRLKGLGHSQRRTAKLLGIDRKSVRKYWNGSCSSTQKLAPSWVTELDWDDLRKELESGVTREVLYQELREPFGLPSYQNFCKMIKKKLKTPVEITYVIPRIPGESVEVDYAGESVSIINPGTGEILKTQLFVATLSYSKRIYAEFTYSQKLEDWINSHNRMFEFYGGAPKYIICDNLKSGVTKACKLDPLINKTYHDQCIHYDITVDPADTNEAKHKPNVEKAVDILQRGFIARNRKKTYTSLGELNRDLRNCLKEKNAETMKAKGVSRDELFEKEKALLTKLPPTPYKMAYWKIAKVHPDCHIQHQYNYYSVPFRHVGKQVEVKYNQNRVSIFLNGEHLSTHKTMMGRGHYSTNEDHYPEKRLVEMQLNYQRINSHAKRIGPHTERLICKVFNEQRFPLKRLRRVQAILALEKAHNHEALEYACEKALEFNKTGYHFIKSCAKNFKPKTNTIHLVTPVREKQFICLQGGAHESID